MEYGAIIWDPYLTTEIDKLESIQRRGARFITKNYKSREEGSLTKMLRDLDLPSLASRRQHQRLIFFYKVVEGMIPAIQPDDYINFQKPKRQIRAKRFEDYTSKNIVTNQERINTRAVAIPENKTDQFRNSLFVKTAIDWNHLDEETVNTKKLEEFKTALAKHRD